MLIIMNDFAGFLFSAVIGKSKSSVSPFLIIQIYFHLALGIGYYLMNGVHPYTRSANHVHTLATNSNQTIPTDVEGEGDESTLPTSAINS